MRYEEDLTPILRKECAPSGLSARLLPETPGRRLDLQDPLVPLRGAPAFWRSPARPRRDHVEGPFLEAPGARSEGSRGPGCPPRLSPAGLISSDRSRQGAKASSRCHGPSGREGRTGIRTGPNRRGPVRAFRFAGLTLVFCRGQDRDSDETDGRQRGKARGFSTGSLSPCFVLITSPPSMVLMRMRKGGFPVKNRHARAGGALGTFLPEPWSTRCDLLTPVCGELTFSGPLSTRPDHAHNKGLESNLPQEPSRDHLPKGQGEACSS